MIVRAFLSIFLSVCVCIRVCIMSALTLSTLTFDANIQEQSLIGNYIGRTYESLIYDGDTLRVICYPLPLVDSYSYSNSSPIKLNVRLQGIDTPELHRGSPEERNAGKIAKETLCSLIVDKYLYIKIVDMDKYSGRYIGIIYLTDYTDDTNIKDIEDIKEIKVHNVTECVNDIMIELKCAVPYKGDKKQSYEQNVMNGLLKI
jgi:endonuclease YncB( thermonuclease family)